MIEKIVNVCYKEKDMNKDILNKKSNIIFNKLCSILDSMKIYRSIAKKLLKFDNVVFISSFVFSLDNILLTEKV